MENPRKTNNIKTFLIGAGAGRFGIGGIVLLGGALVAATITSAVAFKTTSQRRSNLKKSRSPAPETQSGSDKLEMEMSSTSPVTEMQLVDGPNDLESTVKSNKHFSSSDSSPLELQNSSDGVSSMEIQTTNVQSLTPDEMHNYDIENEPGDSSEDIAISLVVEDEENTWIHVDSIFERAGEEQVAMAAQIDKDACLGKDDANSLVSEEGVKLMEEHGVIEVHVQDIVAKVSGNEEDEVHQETVLMNETAENEDEDGQETHIVAKVSENEEEDDEVHQETVLMNEATETAATMEVVTDGTTAKEDTPPSQLMNQEPRGKESAQKLQQQVITEVELIDNDQTNNLGEFPEDEDDNPPRNLMNNEDQDKDEIDFSESEAEASEEHVTKEDKNNNVSAVPQDQLTEAAIVDNQKDNPARKLMNDEEKDQETGVQVKTHTITENMEENQTLIISKNMEEKQAFASKPWNLKVMISAVLISLWCLCHWYSELPFLQLSLVVSLFFVMIFLAPSNRPWSNMVNHV